MNYVLVCGLVVTAMGTATAQPGLTEPETQAPMGKPARAHPLYRQHDPVATDREFGGGVRLTGLSGVGALPGVNIGGELAGYLRWQERFVELGFSKWKPEETIVVSDGPEHIELGLDVWSLRAGWASMKMPLRAWLLVEAGELASPHRVMPAGVPRMVMGSVQPERKWFAAGGGFGVAWPMSDSARLVGNVELAIPIDREEMMFDTGGAFEPDPATARASLGLEVGWR